MKPGEETRITDVKVTAPQQLPPKNQRDVIATEQGDGREGVPPKQLGLSPREWDKFNKGESIC